MSKMPDENRIVVEDIRSKNMFNKNAVTSGALNANGTIEKMEGIYTSDFIEVEPNQAYYKGQSDSARFKFYDVNKNAISSTYADIQNAGNAQAFTIPTSAHYIRLSVTQDYLSSLQIEQGTQATAYCKHFDFSREIKQASNVNITKGQSITDTDIIDAKEVVLFYTVKDDFYSSIVARNGCGTWLLALGENNEKGYFGVSFEAGVIFSSEGTSESIVIIGYDIIK